MDLIRSQIIRIGNSQGLRLPKSVLREAGIDGLVNISVKPGKIIITVDPDNQKVVEPQVVSQIALSKWNNPEEDAAWRSLQSEV